VLYDKIFTIDFARLIKIWDPNTKAIIHQVSNPNLFQYTKIEDVQSINKKHFISRLDYMDDKSYYFCYGIWNYQTMSIIKIINVVESVKFLSPLKYIILDNGFIVLTGQFTISVY